MDVLRNSTSLGFPSTGFCMSPTFGASEPSDSLEKTSRRVRALSPGSSRPLVRNARPVLTALKQMGIATQLATISDQIRHDFHWTWISCNPGRVNSALISRGCSQCS